MNRLLSTLLLVIAASGLKYILLSSAESRQQASAWSSGQVLEEPPTQPMLGQDDWNESAESGLAAADGRPQTVVLALKGSQSLLGQASAND